MQLSGLRLSEEVKENVARDMKEITYLSKDIAEFLSNRNSKKPIRTKILFTALYLLIDLHDEPEVEVMSKIFSKLVREINEEILKTGFKN